MAIERSSLGVEYDALEGRQNGQDEQASSGQARSQDSVLRRLDELDRKVTVLMRWMHKVAHENGMLE